jgi:hypothetical protein
MHGLPYGYKRYQNNWHELEEKMIPKWLPLQHYGKNININGTRWKAQLN